MNNAKANHFKTNTRYQKKINTNLRSSKVFTILCSSKAERVKIVMHPLPLINFNFSIWNRNSPTPYVSSLSSFPNLTKEYKKLSIIFIETFFQKNQNSSKNCLMAYIRPFTLLLTHVKVIITVKGRQTQRENGVKDMPVILLEVNNTLYTCT